MNLESKFLSLTIDYKHNIITMMGDKIIMKTISIFLLVVLLTFVIVPIAFAAQDNSNDLINAVTALIAALGALAANVVIGLIKTIPYFGNEDKDKLATAVTQIISVGVGVLTGWVVALISQWLGLVSDTQLQTTVIYILTPVFSELLYRVKKLQPA